MKWFIALVAVLVIHSWAFGVTNGKLSLVGYVRSFDTTMVTIETNGYLHKIPRHFYPKDVRSGERIVIPFTEAEIASLPKAVPVAKHK